MLTIGNAPPADSKEPTADQPEPTPDEPEQSPEPDRTPDEPEESPEPPTPGEPEEPPEPERQKLARPSGDAQKEVLVQLEQVFDLKGAKTGADKVKLAKELLTLGKESKDNPAERFVLLDKAMELACEGGDAALMIEAIDGIGEDFEIDALEAKQKMLVQFAREAKDSVRIRSLIEAGAPVFEAALAERRYVTAMALVEASYAACTRPGGRTYRKMLYQRREDLKKLVAEEKRFQRALASLQTEPDDAEAHLVVGRWHCCVKGHWEEGLPHLAKGSDAALAAVAVRDVNSSPTEPKPQERLGDAWWGLAQDREGAEKDALLLRAGTWYQQAANQVTGGLARMKPTSAWPRLPRSSVPQPSLFVPRGSAGVPRVSRPRKPSIRRPPRSSQRCKVIPEAYGASPLARTARSWLRRATTGP